MLKYALNILHFYFAFYVVLHYIGWLLLRLVEYLLGVVVALLRMFCVFVVNDADFMVTMPPHCCR